MRICLLLISLVLNVGYLVNAAHQVAQEKPKKEPGLSPGLSHEQVVRAKEIFGEKCARCHGPDGRGQTILGEMLEAPDFTNEKWWQEHGNTDDLIKSITNGNGDMPAFGKKLTRHEISLLADYVRRFNKAEH